MLVLSCSVMSDSFATIWTVTCQVPLSMEFPRQGYCSGLPCLPSGDLPDPGMEPLSPVSPALQMDSLPAEPLDHTLYKLEDCCHIPSKSFSCLIFLVPLAIFRVITVSRSLTILCTSV